MQACLRSVFLSALVVALTPAMAEGQDTSADWQARRVSRLESKVDELEDRIRVLEALLKAQPALPQTLPVTPDWHDTARWRELRRGMTMAKVRQLLGEPDRVEAYASFTVWIYGRNTATTEFNDDEKLTNWNEPQH